jgi:hypothetical protein
MHYKKRIKNTKNFHQKIPCIFEVLAKMERALGVKLRGKEVGQPMVPVGQAKAAAAAKK